MRDAPSLDGIKFKLVRAEKHMNEVIAATRKYAEGNCTIALEKDFECQAFVQRIRLSPSASPEISAMAGDFFANMRAVLDYVVWEMVTANPPHKPGPSNQFPITSTPEGFAKQIARQRLRGVPQAAAALIERLQPYPYRAGDNPLSILNRLHNIDKHRTLNVITVVADNTEVISQAGNFRLILGDEELRDGTVFGGIGIPFKMAAKLPHLESRHTEMKMHGKCSTFVAFDDPAAEFLEEFRVDRVVKEIFYFIRDEVIPAFDPFLNGTPNAI